jgi:SPP1 gp7 family putative phage head morphogenesis protein
MRLATKQRSVDQAILDLAESLEPKYRRAFLEAIERLKGRIDLDVLADALRGGSMLEIEAALSLDTLDQELRELTDRALEAIQKGGQLTAAQVSSSAGAVLAFDIANPRALEVVRRVGGDMIREITELTRAGIREEIGFQFFQGRAPMQTAHVLERRIGLTQYQMQIVRNYEAALRDAVRGEITFGELQRRYTLSPVRGPGGLVDDRIDSAVRQYEARLLALRAEMIARTETIRATEEGRREAWRQAQEAGVLEFDQLREWITARDERTCFLCRPLHGEVAGIERPFPGGVMGPPRHPGCRCSTVLVFPD